MRLAHSSRTEVVILGAVEDMKKTGAKNINVAINNLPLWLFEILKEESEEYGNAYFPVIVNWYRKAKQLDEMVSGPQAPEFTVAEPEPKDEGVALFGGHKGGM